MTLPECCAIWAGNQNSLVFRSSEKKLDRIRCVGNLMGERTIEARGKKGRESKGGFRTHVGEG